MVEGLVPAAGRMTATGPCLVPSFRRPARFQPVLLQCNERPRPSPRCVCTCEARTRPLQRLVQTDERDLERRREGDHPGYSEPLAVRASEAPTDEKTVQLQPSLLQREERLSQVAGSVPTCDRDIAGFPPIEKQREQEVAGWRGDDPHRGGRLVQVEGRWLAPSVAPDGAREGFRMPETPGLRLGLCHGAPMALAVVAFGPRAFVEIEVAPSTRSSSEMPSSAIPGRAPGR